MKQTNPVFHRQQAAAMPQKSSRGVPVVPLRITVILELRLSFDRERLFYRQSILPECLRSLRSFERSN